jgi:hypothetical protein
MMAAPDRRCPLSLPCQLELHTQLRYLLLMIELPSDVAVFAAVCDATGRWSVLSPVAHELSGRHGIRRVWAASNSNRETPIPVWASTTLPVIEGNNQKPLVGTPVKVE